MAAANTEILQTPLFEPQIIPVGQSLMFVVSNVQLVSTEQKVKFIAEVFIGNSPPDTTQTTDLIGIFKTTPNNAGVGMFDVSNVVESYVTSDHLITSGGQYKTLDASNSLGNQRYPIQLVDKFSRSYNVLRYLVIRFSVEYLGADDGVNTVDANLVRTSVGSDIRSGLFKIFNGYLKFTDQIKRSSSGLNTGFGYDMFRFKLTGSSSSALTNAPTTQFANIDDYGTLSFSTENDDLYRIQLTYNPTSGGSSVEYVERTGNNGAYNNWSVSSKRQILHFGCYPANLRNWSSTFNALVSAGTMQGGSIDIIAYSLSGIIAKTYTINVNCTNTKGYESIRLCWLNQWGAWDYYTFTKKSTKTLSTKGSTYNQLGGSWNMHRYYPEGYKGGKKAFRVNTTEKIQMNTGFVTEDDTVMFEELINSPEVYVLDGFDSTDSTYSLLTNYVTPARVTTSSFTRKTIANDKLMQYTFEVEKSKTFRTQAV
jgi:hypothetical protein|tara:strand:- start:5285 stop:6727 length:1443 start_codon:yes stop_codon:yes gene_type:complete